MVGVIMFELAVMMISRKRGIPSVTFLAEWPAKWKVFSVICVEGSPTDCAATTPTASPASTIDLMYFRSMRVWKVFLLRMPFGLVFLSLISLLGFSLTYELSAVAKDSEVLQK